MTSDQAPSRRGRIDSVRSFWIAVFALGYLGGTLAAAEVGLHFGWPPAVAAWAFVCIPLFLISRRMAPRSRN